IATGSLQTVFPIRSRAADFAAEPSQTLQERAVRPLEHESNGRRIDDLNRLAEGPLAGRRPLVARIEEPIEVVFAGAGVERGSISKLYAGTQRESPLRSGVLNPFGGQSRPDFTGIAKGNEVIEGLAHHDAPNGVAPDVRVQVSRLGGYRDCYAGRTRCT